MTTEEELVDEYPEIYQFYHEYDKQPAPQIHVYGFQHREGGIGWLQSCVKNSIVSVSILP